MVNQRCNDTADIHALPPPSVCERVRGLIKTMYDPKQREKAAALQQELSEGRAAKEAFNLLATQMSETCRLFGYTTKALTPVEKFKELVEEVIKLREFAMRDTQVHRIRLKDASDARAVLQEENDRLSNLVAAQNDLIVAYHVDSKELIADAMKRIE